LKPWQKKMWCIPPDQNGQFVARMEQVLDVYSRPYDPLRPLVCMDEQPVQLTSESRTPIPASPGQPAKVDYEYVRKGSCVAWMFVEPLGCWRDVRVTSRRTAVDWAHQMRSLVDDPRFANAELITVVCDNLNTHDPGSLYEAFPPEEAKRIADKLELIFTPKHGSWLNIAESELSVLTRQSLADRVGSQDEVTARVQPWNESRNEEQIGVNWQFQTDNARTKLRHLYPKIET
jgi:hypothetical protein